VVPVSDTNKDKIDRLSRITEIFQDAPFLQRIGLAFATFVRENTIPKNRDIYGNPFQEYSDLYAGKRERAGLGTDVDLIFSRLKGIDAMMDSIDDLLLKGLSGVAMFFRNSRAEQLARYHNIEGAGKSRVIRRFWGLTDEHKQKITDMVGEHANEFLRTQL